MCDGSIHFLTKSTDLAILKMLATRAGGEIVNPRSSPNQRPHI